MKGCALILMEHAPLYPQNVKLYAALTANAIVSQMGSSHLKQRFLQHLSQYFLVEINKWFKSENPEKSNWTRIGNVGAFLAELYNFEVVDVELVKSWTEIIFPCAAMLDCGPAVESLLKLYQTIAAKISERDSEALKAFLVDAEALASTDTAKESYKELQRVLQTKVDERVKVLPVVTAQMAPAPLVAAPAPLMMAPAPLMVNQAPLVVTPTPQNMKKSLMDELQKIVVNLNAANINSILTEIVHLKIPVNEDNLRKIANTLISRAKQRPDVAPAAAEVLANLPKAAKHANSSQLKKQIKLSLSSAFHSICAKKRCMDIDTTLLINVAKLLHEHSAIEFRAIIELIEELANIPKQDNYMALLLVLNLIKANSEAFKLTKMKSMRRTEEMLESHLSCGVSDSVRKEIETCLKLIMNSILVPIIPVPTNPPLQAPPMIPHPSQVVLCQLGVLTFIDVVKTCNMDQLEEVFDKLKVETAPSMKIFIKTFAEAMAVEIDFEFFVRLAVLIDKEVEQRGIKCELPFKLSLIAFVQEYFYELLATGSWKSNGMKLQTLMKFNGELYNVGWISWDQMCAMLTKLLDPHLPLELFHALLQTISMTMVVKGDSGKCKGFQKIIKTRAAQVNQTRHHLLYQTVGNVLELMCSEATHQNLDEGQVRAILFDLTADNAAEAAAKLKSLPLKMSQDQHMKSFIKLLVAKAISEPEEAEMCARLAAEICDLFTDGKAFAFEDALLEDCQKLLLHHFNDGIKLCQLSETMGALQFIGELYNLDVIDENFIHLSLKLLLYNESENAADAISKLVRTVGAKADNEYNEEFEELFKNFEKIARQKNSYRVAIFKDLVELRRNGWQHDGEQASVTELPAPTKSTIEGALSSLSQENLAAVSAVAREFLSESETKIKEFIEALWKKVLASPEAAKLHAELCKNISNRTFRQHLTDFLQCRNITFMSLQREEFTARIKNRLANVLLFVAELFSRDLVSDEVLDSWLQLKLAKHLSFDSLTQLIATIDARKMTSRLSISMINLNALTHEHSMDVWKELRGDIGEILEVVSDLHETIAKALTAEK